MALPWPWAGELFEIRGLRPVTYLVGPLGSGKTRLAAAMADALGGQFMGLRRNAEDFETALAGRHISWLLEDGATQSDTLHALIAGIVRDQASPCIIDLIENDLDEPTQLALGSWLRHRGPEDRPLIVMTRSSAILDIEAVSPGHAILYCPANHSPPFIVPAIRGGGGYESVVQCLGTPEARARVTQGLPRAQTLENNPR